MKSIVEDFLTSDQEQEIIEAIRIAEMRTSGEIRVHLEKKCKGDAMTRAQELFHLLKMDNTKEENGVLLYIAVESHKFALIGDRGIHEHVKAAFWEEVTAAVASRFRESEFSTGIVLAINHLGKALAQYFPWDETDTNELSNEISVS